MRQELKQQRQQEQFTRNNNIDNKNKGELPIVISPGWDSSLAFLMSWCDHNRLRIDEMIQQYGAMLLRGFAFISPAEMEKVVRSYQPNQKRYERDVSIKAFSCASRFMNLKRQPLSVTLQQNDHKLALPFKSYNFQTIGEKVVEDIFVPY